MLDNMCINFRCKNTPDKKPVNFCSHCSQTCGRCADKTHCINNPSNNKTQEAPTYPYLDPSLEVTPGYGIYRAEALAPDVELNPDNIHDATEMLRDTLRRDPTPLVWGVPQNVEPMREGQVHDTAAPNLHAVNDTARPLF